MGLDVGLRKYQNFNKAKRLEKEYEVQSEKIWEAIKKGRKFEELSKEESDEASRQTDELAVKLGLGKYGEYEEGKECIELDSKKYPKHMFKIGYFRSSYNDGGINHILENTVGSSLYDIFEPTDDYEFQPDWERAKQKTEEAIKKFKKYMKTSPVNVQVIDFFGSTFHKDKAPKSPEEAIKHYLKEVESHKPKKGKKDFFGGSYSNGFGSFDLDKPMKVRAIITGYRNLLRKDEPVAYVIYDHDGLEWYLEALEVVLETIKYVMKQEDRDNYYLSWSA